ncbi:MAG TPA: hypothetical protein VK897_22070 [Anaerolineales bacterium]|nr:hypothetical protein [Anaerolineales bacterium]
MRKLNFFVVFSLCTLATFLVLNTLNYPLIGIDDANIYFVYARNFADGHGFVFNIGGERVEGFTSLLWTLITAIAFKFFAYPELSLLIINIVLVSLGITYALDYLQQLPSPAGPNQKMDRFWRALFLLILFTSPRYIVWNTITLMENALWSTLLLMTTILVTRDYPSFKNINYSFVPLSILLLLTRPESILWVVIFISVLFFRIVLQSNITDALKTLAPSIVGIVLGSTLLTLFRLLYFGYPFPNTYYAKVSPSLAYNFELGLLYLVRYFVSDPIVTISITAVFLTGIVSLLRPAPKDQAFFLPFIAVIGLLMPLLTGGDHFGSFRFYQNVYPIIILSLVHSLTNIFRRVSENSTRLAMSLKGRAVLFSGLSLLLVCGLSLSQARAWSQFAEEIAFEFKIAASERRKGAFIQEVFSSLMSLPSVGVTAAGGIKYSYHGEIIDLLGLNNTTMAHNHGDRTGYKSHAAFEVRTFYELQPQVVWPLMVNSQWQYSEANLKNGWENTVGLKGLFDDPLFLELYKYAKIVKTSEPTGETAIVAWFRKDFLESLMTRDDLLIEEYEYDPQGINGS